MKSDRRVSAAVTIGEDENAGSEHRRPWAGWHGLRLASVAPGSCASRLLHLVLFGFLRARVDELFGRAATFLILVLAARLFDLMPGSPMNGVSRERGIASFFGPIQFRIGDHVWFGWTGRNR